MENWLKNNTPAISNFLNISAKALKLILLLVTSGRVPMQFFIRMKLSELEVLPEEDLEIVISKNLP